MNRNYKFHNPVRIYFVRPEDYIYSCTRDYSGEKGMLEDVDMVK